MYIYIVNTISMIEDIELYIYIYIYISGGVVGNSLNDGLTSCHSGPPVRDDSLQMNHYSSDVILRSL